MLKFCDNNEAKLLLVVVLTLASACAPSRPDTRVKPDKTTTLQSVKSEVVEQRVGAPPVSRAHSRDLSELGDGSDVSSAKRLSGSSFTRHKAHKGEVHALVVSDTGSEAYSGGLDGKIVRSRIVETPKGKKVHTTEVIAESSREILTLALSLDGRTLAVGQYSSVSLLDLQTLEFTHQLTRIRGRIGHLSWDPRGEFVLFGLRSGKIFAWKLANSEYAGENSLKAIEEYSGAVSSIVGLAVHPEGKVFFAAERSGRVIVWRLIRTEEEMGLRSKNTVVDKSRVSRSAKLVTNLEMEIVSFLLTDDGAEIYSLTLDGVLRPWKVRGLVPQPKVMLGKGGIVDLNELVGLEERLLTVATRSQKIRLFCKNPSVKRDPGLTTLDPNIVATSPIFSEPLIRLVGARDRPVLWATQKSGSVLMLDLENSKLENLCIS